MSNSLLPLVPLNQIAHTSVMENPLATLIRENPHLGHDLIRREQALREKSMQHEERIAALSVVGAVAGGQASQICQWLNNRQPHETSASAEFEASYEENGFFFSRSKKVTVKSSFTIS